MPKAVSQEFLRRRRIVQEWNRRCGTCTPLHPPIDSQTRNCDASGFSSCCNGAAAIQSQYSCFQGHDGEVFVLTSSSPAYGVNEVIGPEWIGVTSKHLPGPNPTIKYVDTGSDKRQRLLSTPAPTPTSPSAPNIAFRTIHASCAHGSFQGGRCQDASYANDWSQCARGKAASRHYGADTSRLQITTSVRHSVGSSQWRTANCHTHQQANSAALGPSVRE